MIPYEFPVTLGWDVAGEITELGADVTGWSVGDQVYSRPDIGRNGTFAEFVAVHADEIAAKHGIKVGFVFIQPDGAQLKELATLIDDGKVTVAVDSVFPLKDVAAAQDKSATNRAKGKIVIQVV
jgi:NADPH:quinone reductase-like Zn-dependent oxidoreductase